MTRDKLFHREYSKTLLKIAEGDIQSAEVLALNIAKGRPENICFAAQQAIDKSLKAVLCFHQKPIPMTHSIELLIDRLRPSCPPHAESLVELTDFATIRRYEEGNEIITVEDITAIIAIANLILAWAKNEINQPST